MKEYIHPVSGKVTIVDRQGFLDLFDKDVHTAILDRLARPGVLGVVCYENIDMCSSHIGERTALIFGTGLTATTAEEACSNRLGDVPSRFQYPRYIHLKGTPRPEPEQAEQYIKVGDIVHQLHIDSSGRLTIGRGDKVDRFISDREYSCGGWRLAIERTYPAPIATGPTLAPVSLAPISMFVYAKWEDVEAAKQALVRAYVEQCRVFTGEAYEIINKINRARDAVLTLHGDLMPQQPKGL